VSAANPDPTLFDVIEAVVQGMLARMQTSLPGQIREFDTATHTATVQIAIDFEYVDDAGERQSYRPEPIANVPVAFPGGGEYGTTHPIEQGQTCLLVFASRSIDEWYRSGGVGNLPASKRRFDPTDAICLPLSPRPKSATDLPTYEASAMVVSMPAGGSLKLGQGATSFVALADKLATQFGILKAAYDIHVHPIGTPNVGVPTVLAPTITSNDVAADKVKAE